MLSRLCGTATTLALYEAAFDCHSQRGWTHGCQAQAQSKQLKHGFQQLDCSHGCAHARDLSISFSVSLLWKWSSVNLASSQGMPDSSEELKADALLRHGAAGRPWGVLACHLFGMTI